MGIVKTNEKSNTNRVAELLKELSVSLGTPLELDDDGICTLKGDDDLVLVVEAPRDDPRMHLYAPLLDLPPEGIEDIYRELLVMNCFTRRTFGGVLALDPESHVVLFCYTELPERLDGQSFPGLLAGFREAAQAMRKQLKELLRQYAIDKIDPTDEELEASFPLDKSDSFESEDTVSTKRLV